MGNSQILKKKVLRYQKDLAKVQDQKAVLQEKEKTVKYQLKEAKAEYIVSLMAESGKTLEELEHFAQRETFPATETMSGGDGHV